MPTPSYRLDTEKWIPVVTTRGQNVPVSLLDAIRDAPAIRRIVGNPLEAAVLHRLLLAIAHVVCTPADEYAWLDVWRDRGTLLGAMAEYVAANAAAFDLYDEERPFAQTRHLLPGKGSPAALVYHCASGNNPVFVDHSQDAAPRPIASAEAARALLVAHAFGGSGTGSNNPLNDNRKDQMRAGPLAARMIAIVQGDDLAETLVLNLISGVRVGRPAWSRPAVLGPGGSPSEGVADLYTRNTRAVRLAPSPDGAACVGVAVYQGLAIPAEDGADADPMIPRYLASDKSYKDLRLSQDRAVWRSADVLLAAAPSSRCRPIRALEQLRPLAGAGDLPDEDTVSLRVTGVCGDAQGPKTYLWRDESLPFGLSVVADDEAYAAMSRAVDAARREEGRLRGRLHRFARAYLGYDHADQPRDQRKGRESLDAFIGDLVECRSDRQGSKAVVRPLFTRFWAALAPAGERVACGDLGSVARAGLRPENAREETASAEDLWDALLRQASDDCYRHAVDALPPTARRLRAEFAAGARAEATRETDENADTDTEP